MLKKELRDLPKHLKQLLLNDVQMLAIYLAAFAENHPRTQNRHDDLSWGLIPAPIHDEEEEFTQSSLNLRGRFN